MIQKIGECPYQRPDVICKDAFRREHCTREGLSRSNQLTRKLGHGTDIVTDDYTILFGRDRQDCWIVSVQICSQTPICQVDDVALSDELQGGSHSPSNIGIEEESMHCQLG